MPEHTIAENLTRLQNAKTAIGAAITAKGGTVASGDGLEEFAADIGTIPSGGGGTSVSKKDVTFYDYDGTVVNSYTAAEFAELTAMPDNPSHEGLTAQGWNWSLSDAKTYVASYGKLNIGQMYTTSDGKTRLYIELIEGRLQPWLKLYLNANSELDIDWGDGSTHSTFTRGTYADYVSEMHTYASAGSYVIVITVVSGGFELRSSSTGSSTLLTNNNANEFSPDAAYLNSIKKIEIGSGVTRIKSRTFYNCTSLVSITIPSSVTSIEEYSFYNCRSLTSITIPSGVTSIKEQSFYNCTLLASITIPSSVTSIGNNAFSSCLSLASITIPSSVTSIGNNAFSNCISLVSITIPSSVTSIGNNAFQYLYTLTSITIPSSVTSIGSQAFFGCSSLTSITIPSSVTSIGSQAFSNCWSLATITINKPTDSISGSPWGAITTSPTYTQIVWTG